MAHFQGQPPAPSHSTVVESELKVLLSNEQVHRDSIIAAFNNVMLGDGLEVMKHLSGRSKKFARRILRFLPDCGGSIVWYKLLPQPKSKRSKIPIQHINEIDLDQRVVWISAGDDRVGFETPKVEEADLIYQGICILVWEYRRGRVGKEWSAEEDKIFSAFVGQGTFNWEQLATRMPSRCGGQVGHGDIGEQPLEDHSMAQTEREGDDNSADAEKQRGGYNFEGVGGLGQKLEDENTHKPNSDSSVPTEISTQRELGRQVTVEESAVPDIPWTVPADGDTPDGNSIELVAQFGATPAAFSLADAGVRLSVGPNCLKKEQVAGPITVMTDKVYLVECGAQCYQVSVVVDCQPSGSKFDAPLELDFRVGEPLDEEDEDSDPVGNRGADLDDMQREEYMSTLRDTYKVLVRNESSDAWDALGEEKTTVVYERGMFFVRASIDHFSQGCLAKTIQPESAYHEETAIWPFRPGKRELEFVNTTDRPLVFLVMPTSWSNKATHAVAMGLAWEGLEAHVAISRAIEQSILAEATHPQILQVPCNKRKGDPRAGQICPYATCRLAKSTGNEARVALITADSQTVAVWDYRIVRHKTRLAILPGQFSEGMIPILGEHKRDELAKGALCLMDVALMATVKGLRLSKTHAPVSTISSSTSSVETGGRLTTVDDKC